MGEIAKEVAEQEFERFVEAMDLDIAPETMDEKERQGFSECKRRVIDALCASTLVIDEKGQLTFTPSADENKTPVTFYEPDGACWMAIDQAKPGHDMTKNLLFLVAMTRSEKSRFAKMPNRDLKVCLAIAALAMGG